MKPKHNHHHEPHRDAPVATKKQVQSTTKIRAGCVMSVFCFGMLFSVLGFVLHFAWEYSQCSAFFLHIKNIPTPGAMAFAAGGDIVIMWTVYLMMAFKYKSLTWFRGDWNFRTKLSLIGFSVLFAIVVEIWALKTERWAYTENNQVLPLFGFSIVPVLQMALINPVSFFVTKQIVASLVKSKCKQPKEN